MRATPTEGLLPVERIPGPPRLSILRGIGKQIAFHQDPIAYMQGLRAAYGDIVRFHTRFSSVIFGFGPKYNRIVNTETDRFISRAFLPAGRKRSALERLNDSLFSLNHERHKDMRHALLPPFQKSILDTYYAEIVHLIRRGIDCWRAGGQLDLRAEMHRVAWHIAAKLLFGLDDSHADGDMHHAIEEWLTTSLSASVTLFPFDLPLTKYRRAVRQAAGLEERMRAILRAKREGGMHKHDALAALIRTRDAGPKLSEDELVSHALTLLLVAYETTANTLTWTLFLLATHPEAQANLLDELAFLNKEAPTFEQQKRLPYLDHVVKESMRLLPAVPYSRRKTAVAGAFGDYYVPANTRVMFSHYLTHHMPELYPQPEQFRPERWDSIDPGPAEYLPFGAGLRTCVGVSLAPFIIKCVLAEVLPRWRLTVLPNARIDRTVGISLGPKHGIPAIAAVQDRRFEVVEIHGDIHEMVDLKYAATQASTAQRRMAA